MNSVKSGNSVKSVKSVKSVNSVKSGNSVKSVKSGNSETNSGNNTVDLTNTRAYMIKMRHKKDRTLFKFKSNKLVSPYSRTCSAVDMRQPIIMNNREYNKNKESDYREPLIEDKRHYLKWGSSAKNINYYTCPRIWCVRCNIAISPLQYLETVETVKGKSSKPKCPNPKCGGEEITGSITKKKTILIRRGGANNYWSKDKIPDEFISDLKKHKKDIELYKELWEQHLKGAEKTAYPGLLKPKLHPKNKCMPCCFTNRKSLGTIKTYKNIDKCFVQDINYKIDDRTIKATELKPDYKIRKSTLPKLKIGDIILLVHDSENKYFYEITEYGSVPLDTNGYGYSGMKLDFIDGMVINNKVHNQKHIVYKKNDKLVIEDYNVKTADTNYIMGEEKFPLLNNKYGILPKKLDDIFNKNSASLIVKGMIKTGSSLVLRRGINQNRENSL